MNKMQILILFLIFCAIFLIFRTDEQKIPDAKIVTELENTNAINIDKYITYPIGEILLSMKEVENIEEFSYMEKSVIYVYFYKKYKKNEFLFEKLRRKLDEAEYRIPKNAKTIIDDKFKEPYLALIGISGENATYEELYDTAKKIKNELLNLKPKRRIDIIGSKKEALYIYFKNSILSELKITPDEIYDFINNANPMYKTSFFDTGKNLIQIQAKNEFDRENDIENVVIYLNERELLLKNIFDIKKTIINPELSKVHINGKEGLILGIYPNDDFDILTIWDVKNKISKLKKKFRNVDIEELFINSFLASKNILEIKLYLNESACIDETKKAVKKIEDFLKKQKNIISTSSYIGISAPTYDKINISDNNTANEAIVLVNAKNIKIEKIKTYMDENIPNVQYIIKKSNKKPFQIRIISNKTDELFEYSKRITDILKKEDDIYLIKTDWGDLIPYYSIYVNENAAILSGVNPYIFFDYLNTYYNGKKISKYYRGEVEIPIILKGHNTKIKPSDISFYSKKTNSTIPVNQISKINSDFTYSKVVRHNNIYALTIQAWFKNKQYTIFSSINSKLKNIKGSTWFFIQ